MFWPEGETFCENLNKRKIYFYPHCYIPKLFFALQPVAALRAAIFYIFKLILGVDNENQAKYGLAKINIKLLGPFQTFFGMVLDIWQLGYPKNIPASLGTFFQVDLISDLIENIISWNQTCLSLNSKMITLFGLNPLISENFTKTQSKAHSKLCKRISKIPSILCLLSRECVLCGVDFKSEAEM